MPSKRKFYRTVYEVEVLSEWPIDNDEDLRDIAREAVEGQFSWEYRQVHQDEVDGPMMAKLLEDQGSDPEFFELTADGEDTELGAMISNDNNDE